MVNKKKKNKINKSHVKKIRSKNVPKTFMTEFSKLRQF